MLRSQSHNGVDWLKDQLMKEFNMKDLGKAKISIGWEITRDLKVVTLKIDQKSYICNLLEAKKMSLCYPTVFPIKLVQLFF